MLNVLIDKALLSSAVIAALLSGLLVFLHKLQQSRLDRSLNEYQMKIRSGFEVELEAQKTNNNLVLEQRISELTLYRSAFDIKFKAEFDVYQAIWPLIGALITELEMKKLPTFGVVEDKYIKDRWNKVLMPASELVFEKSLFLPKEIREQSELFVSGCYGHLIEFDHPGVYEPPIFTPPVAPDELVELAKRLRDAIVSRIEMHDLIK